MRQSFCFGKHLNQHVVDALGAWLLSRASGEDEERMRLERDATHRRGEGSRRAAPVLLHLRAFTVHWPVGLLSRKRYAKVPRFRQRASRPTAVNAHDPHSPLVCFTHLCHRPEHWLKGHPSGYWGQTRRRLVGLIVGVPRLYLPTMGIHRRV